MTVTYPLQWPEGWPRVPAQLRDDGSRFKTGTGYEYDSSSPTNQKYVGKKIISFEGARRLLTAELTRLNATDVVLSSNLPVRLDGFPYASSVRLRMDDPGVAVYFTMKKRNMVMAQDAFSNIAANVRSLGLAIEALRQLERHGGGKMMERAFTGFLAITPPTWKKPWREVFGVKPEWTGDINALFREKAKLRHPDYGGNDTLMAELNLAYEEAKSDLEIGT